jgi:hypothetical protein
VQRIARWSLLVAGALALVELLSFAAGTVLFGWGFARQAAETRSEVAAGSVPKLGLGEVADLPAALDFYAIHPYLGFVADPARFSGPLRDGQGRLEITPLGFFRRTGKTTRGHPLRVAILGGSVAFMFSLTADEQLERAVAAHLDSPDGVTVESFALPGHKQPQQLFTLVYLLALGDRPDVVVNIDGFNEVTLPLAENLQQGTAAIYPRSWGRLLSGVADLGAMPEVAQLASLRAARRFAAETFSAPIVRNSMTGALLWRLVDGVIEPRILAADDELQHHLSGGKGYAAAGPPSGASSADEVLGGLVALWQRSSLLMQQICSANGIAYVHVLQPNQYLPGAKALSLEEREKAYREDHPYRSAVEHGYPRLRDAAASLRAQGVDFVDLTLLYRDVSETVFADDCCHVNRLGNQMIADAIAPAIVEAVRRAAPDRSRGAP